MTKIEKLQVKLAIYKEMYYNSNEYEDFHIWGISNEKIQNYALSKIKKLERKIKKCQENSK